MSDTPMAPHRELVWMSKTADGQTATLHHRQEADGRLYVDLNVGQSLMSYTDDELAALGNGYLSRGVELLTKTVESVHGYSWDQMRPFDREVCVAKPELVAAS